MDGEALFTLWVPPDGVWSLWARPVLFAQMDDVGTEETDPAAPLPAVAWAPDAADRTLLVLDLPGQEAVLMGLALAGRGYRPVPLFNACTGPHEVIDQGPILRGLRAGAELLATLTLAADAPPVFLLDAHRMTPVRDVRSGAFDNRWKVFPQDFPSAGYLRTQGIGRVVLVQRSRQEPREDLAHVLRRWQDANIPLATMDLEQATPPQPLAVDRPKWYRRFWYRALTLMGLRRNPRGGFGGVVPEPSHG